MHWEYDGFNDSVIFYMVSQKRHPFQKQAALYYNLCSTCMVSFVSWIFKLEIQMETGYIWRTLQDFKGLWWKTSWGQCYLLGYKVGRGSVCVVFGVCTEAWKKCPRTEYLVDVGDTLHCIHFYSLIVSPISPSASSLLPPHLSAGPDCRAVRTQGSRRHRCVCFQWRRRASKGKLVIPCGKC